MEQSKFDPYLFVGTKVICVVYVDMPLDFAQYSKDGTKKCLKLTKTLYGLRQSPRSFWKYITKKLEICGLEQSNFDPCLFVGTKVICVVDVDDLIFWSKDTLAINDSAMQLRELGVDLEQEDDAAGFLESHWNETHKRVCLK